MTTIKTRMNYFIKSKNIKNSFWIIGEQIFQMAIALIVGIITARYLGPSNYGALNYTASFVAFALSVANLGMEGIVIKKMVEAPGNEGVIMGSCLAFRMISGFACAISVSILVFLFNIRDELKLVLAILQSIQLIFRAGYIFDLWFQLKLKSKYVSVGKMIACVIVSSYKIVLLCTGKSLAWFAFSNSLTDIVVAVMLYTFYKKQNGPSMTVKFSVGLGVLKESYHFIVSSIMTAIYSQMDKIMIGQMLTDLDVGYYTTATNICSMWIFVPLAIISSFQPLIMQLKMKDEKLYRKRLTQLYSAIIWICILVSCLITVFAGFIVGILYGSEYQGAVTPLRISILYQTFAMIGSVRGIWILCENKNKYVKYYLIIGAVVNLVLNSLMIPRMGINGAAIATLITQLTTSIIAPILFRETRKHTGIVIDALLLRWRDYD